MGERTFARELSMLDSAAFAHLAMAHLVGLGFDLAGTTHQSDNGSEFVGSWQSRGKSEFTRKIESAAPARHVTIPPGAHTWQSDVESFHNPIETEFLQCQRFDSREGFLAKASTCMAYFNTERKNSAREWKTALEPAREKRPRAPAEAALFRPVILDELAEKCAANCQRGYDVLSYPWRDRPVVRPGPRRAKGRLDRRREDFGGFYWSRHVDFAGPGG